MNDRDAEKRYQQAVSRIEALVAECILMAHGDRAVLKANLEALFKALSANENPEVRAAAREVADRSPETWEAIIWFGAR